MNTKEGYFFDVLGDSHSGLGRHDEAIEAYCRAVTGFHTQGTEHAYVYCLLKIAVSYRALGKESHAVRYLQACLPLIRELRLVGYEEIALRELAACAVAVPLSATRGRPFGQCGRPRTAAGHALPLGRRGRPVDGTIHAD